jgi:DNA-binding transcriptional LysR family regulator
VKISLRRLAVFKAILDKGGVNAAADHLGISQPSVTAHLKALELEIGEPLFVRRRGRRHLETTAAGKLLERYAEEALSKSEELAQTLALARVGDVRTLRVAAQRVLANNEISPVIADFLLQTPDARLTLHSETQEIVRRLYLTGEVDLAFLYASRADSEAAGDSIGVERLGFIAAPHHPLAARASIEPSELCDWPFVGGLQESEFFGLVQEAVGRAGVERMRFILHLQDTLAVQSAVARNIGLACTIVSAVREDARRGDLVVLPVSGSPPELAIRCLNRAPACRLRRLAEALIAAAAARWAARAGLAR